MINDSQLDDLSAAILGAVLTLLGVAMLAGCATIRTASKPCILQSNQSLSMIRDTLRECWRDAKREEFNL